MNESLPVLLLRRSEGGAPAYLLGVPDLSPAAAGAFTRLIELGAIEHDRRLESWDPCGNCTCGAEERPIRWSDGHPVAICPVSREHDQRLEPDDLQLFRVSVSRLVELVSRAAALADRPEEISPSLWRLGRIGGGRVLLLATASSALQAPGAFDRLRAVDKSARFIAIATVTSAVEVSMLAERGIDVVAPEDAFLPSEPARPIRLDIEGLASGTVASDPDLLDINLMARTASFGGRTLPLGPRDFRVLHILAREADDGGAAATRDDLYTALVDRDDGHATISDEQVDKAISRIRGELCAARGLPGTAGRKLITVVRGHGYRLVTPNIRVLIR